jgi:putative PIN family toxin of toxin-antitoxin system
MRVLLDTNVLASAAATRGLCADVLREVFASHELVLSGHVLKELKRVLKVKFGVPSDLIDEFIWLLRQDAAFVEAAAPPGVKLRDKADLPILGAAVAARVEVLVTGDKELLELGRVEHVAILSPRQFWERLKTKRKRRTKRSRPRR